MGSVSSLVEATAKAMSVEESTVSQYSRQLINAGLLPKSRGRAVAAVGPRDAIRLILAVGLDGRFNASASKVSGYTNLLHDGVPQVIPQALEPGLRSYLSETVEDSLYYSMMLVIAPDGLVPEQLEGQRRAHRNLRYEFILNWPQVLVHDQQGGVVEAFKRSGTLLGHLEATTYTSFTLSCHLFDALSDFDFGLKAQDWAEFFEEALK